MSENHLNNYALTKGEGISPAEALAIRYYALGDPLSIVACKTKLSTSRIRKALSSQGGKDELSRIRTELDEEFFNLQHQVNENLREGLSSEDINVALSCTKMWLSAAKQKQVNIIITAEDILKQIFSPEEVVQPVIDIPSTQPLNLQELK